MLLADFIRQGTARLSQLYPSPEERGLVLMLCEKKLGTVRYAHIIEPQTPVPAEREAELEEDLRRLCAGEPVQYVLGVAEFCGHRFAVGPGVLVPRPETELLVAAGVNALRGMDSDRAPRVLDLCTGSGCIAWSIALEISDAEVIGVDLSEAALHYAANQFPAAGSGKAEQKLVFRQTCPERSDAGGPGGTPPGHVICPLRFSAVGPDFVLADILDTEQDFPYGPFDLIVSNPPYVRESEKALMRPNVLGFEPPEALFVPDEDPLLFYRAIARWAQRFLRPGGVGIVEINEALGTETATVFRDAGFKNVQIQRDFFRKERFIRFDG